MTNKKIELSQVVKKSIEFTEKHGPSPSTNTPPTPPAKKETSYWMVVKKLRLNTLKNGASICVYDGKNWNYATFAQFSPYYKVGYFNEAGEIVYTEPQNITIR